MTEITQDALDKHQAALRRSIKALDDTAAAADSAADQLCTSGAFEVSRDVGLIAAELRAAAAHADRAYRLARALRIPTSGGVIQPSFGGKD